MIWKKQKEKTSFQDKILHFISIVVMYPTHFVLGFGAYLVFSILKILFNLISSKTLFFVAIIVGIAPLFALISFFGMYITLLPMLSEKIYESKNGTRYKVFAIYFLVGGIINFILSLLLKNELPSFGSVYNIAFGATLLFLCTKSY